MRNLVVEFVGTFFLVLTIALSGGDPLAIGSVLMVMVYFGGHISGGHYNPAVSLAVWVRGRLDASRLFPYIVVQVAGAVVAGAVFYYFRGRHFIPSPARGVSIESALLAEFLFTFALCAVVLVTTTSSKMRGNQIYGLAIGSAVLVGVASVGSISGGALNPAVGTGPALSAWLFGQQSLSSVWIYWFGPGLAGVAAGLFYRLIYRVRSKRAG